MALTPLHVQNFCQASSINNNAVAMNYCKYLEMNASGYCCTKLHPNKYAKLKDERDKWLDKMIKLTGLKMHDPNNGDNCQGYLYLTHAKQGFDVKGSK